MSYSTKASKNMFSIKNFKDYGRGYHGIANIFILFTYWI